MESVQNVLKLSQVGSGRLGSAGVQNLTCRVELVEEVFKISLVGLGRVRRSSKSHGLGRFMTGEIWVMSRTGLP